MKFISLAALGLAAALAVPAVAEDSAATTATAAAFTIDTPIEVLMADERAKALLNMHFGMDLATHPAYEQFKALSLKTLAPFSQGLITEDMLTKIASDLAAIK